MLTRRQQGVTLVELTIGVAISAVLLGVALPAFSQWIQGLQDRTAAESIVSGLQLARAEAVRRNAAVRFDLTDTDGGAAWKVGCVVATTQCPATIASRSAKEGGPNARVGVSTDALPSPLPAGHFGTAIAAGTGLAAGVTFNGLGRVPSDNVGTDITRIDVTNAAKSSAHRFVVTVSTGGTVRMCDPELSRAATPQGCS